MTSKIHLHFVMIFTITMFSCRTPNKNNSVAESEPYNQNILETNGIALYGHRGASAFNPENSLSSLKEAWKYASGAELDVQISKDGVPFVLHDDTLWRTAHMWSENQKFGEGLLKTPVNKISWGEIKNISIGPHEEKVPSLEEVLKILDDLSEKNLLIELKSYAASELKDKVAMIDALERVISRASDQLKKRLILISFDRNALLEAQERKNLKLLRTYWLLEEKDIEEGKKSGKIAEILKNAEPFTGLDLESGSYLRTKLPTYSGKNIVSLLNEKNKKVIVWVSRRKRTDGMYWFAEARKAGVSVFTSDLPAELIYPERYRSRFNLVFEVLRREGLSPKLGLVEQGCQSYKILLNSRNFYVFSPIDRDFYNPQNKFDPSFLGIDLSHVTKEGDSLLLNLSDLSPQAKKSIVNYITTLRQEQKKGILGIDFEWVPAKIGSLQLPIYSVQELRDWLQRTRAIKGYRIIDFTRENFQNQAIY